MFLMKFAAVISQLFIAPNSLLKVLTALTDRETVSGSHWKSPLTLVPNSKFDWFQREIQLKVLRPTYHETKCEELKIKIEALMTEMNSAKD